jgi:phage gp36-like protein
MHISLFSLKYPYTLYTLKYIQCANSSCSNQINWDSEYATLEKEDLPFCSVEHLIEFYEKRGVSIDTGGAKKIVYAKFLVHYRSSSSLRSFFKVLLTYTQNVYGINSLAYKFKPKKASAIDDIGVKFTEKSIEKLTNIPKQQQQQSQQQQQQQQQQQHQSQLLTPRPVSVSVFEEKKCKDRKKWFSFSGLICASCRNQIQFHEKCYWIFREKAVLSLCADGRRECLEKQYASDADVADNSENSESYLGSIYDLLLLEETYEKLNKEIGDILYVLNWDFAKKIMEGKDVYVHASILKIKVRTEERQSIQSMQSRRCLCFSRRSKVKVRVKIYTVNSHC